MEAKDNGEAKRSLTTPDKQQKEFYEHEAGRPMKVATHFMGGGGAKGKGKSRNQFQPSSPTDRMLSPCSRKLMRKKSSLHDEQEANLDFWSPPAEVELILGSSSQCRRDILDELGWSFSVMIPDIDERDIEVGAALPGGVGYTCACERHIPDLVLNALYSLLPHSCCSFLALLQEKCETGSLDVPVLIAKAKAAAILSQLQEQDQAAAIGKEVDEEGGAQARSRVVITSDQIVLFRNKVRGKPRDAAEARQFLASYQDGEMCQTVAAVVATHLPSGRQASQVDICSVHWSGIPEEAWEGLLAKEEVFWSCGGFLIEDEDFVRHVHRIEGSVDSIRGLPIRATKKAISDVLSSSAGGRVSLV
jgi:septum formation protein